jgi:DNA-binding transcriptional MocR family regulator
MGEWSPLLSRLGKPRYRAIADAIAEDIRNGKLAPLDRLPPQRKLARRLNIDFTTVARGYVEAQKRGLRGRSCARRRNVVTARSRAIRRSSICR